ncbi:hypothetical protein PIROE2DRAFT_14769 [Piromyces sp. E2]|nr:hypothetical protein PIROE2DRAFT_14769 [Piromyces sp. E2]|eukprot:OUM59625.1 hypothetical protein PIROE2DRAFT_14769 [Piromyces sp. E2]
MVEGEKGFVTVIPFYDSPSITGNNIGFIRMHYSVRIIVILAIQVASIIYDLVIVYYLKNKFFKKCKNNTELVKNNFIEKLKITSEYRIVVSIMVSCILLPIGILFYLEGPKEKERVLFETLFDYRNTLIYFNYYIMYVDQILLRFYAERNSPKFKISSTNTYMFRKRHQFSLKSLASGSLSNSSSIRTFISRNKRQYSSRSLFSNSTDLRSNSHSVTIPEAADSVNDFTFLLSSSNTVSHTSSKSSSLKKILFDNSIGKPHLSSKSVVSFTLDKPPKCHTIINISKTSSLSDSGSVNSPKAVSVDHIPVKKSIIDISSLKKKMEEDTKIDEQKENKKENGMTFNNEENIPVEENKSVEENNPFEENTQMEENKLKEENKSI